MSAEVGGTHTFRFVWAVRGAGANWWSDDVTIEIEAYSLKAAMLKMTDMPLFELMGSPTEEDS